MKKVLLGIVDWFYYGTSERWKSFKHRFFIHYNRFLFLKKNVVYGENMRVYNHVYVRGNGTITIGNDFLFTSGDSINPICRNIRGCLYTSLNGQIIIGDHVGISSATIWAKEKIGAGSVVTSDIPADCIAAGNLCKVIRSISNETVNSHN